MTRSACHRNLLYLAFLAVMLLIHFVLRDYVASPDPEPSQTDQPVPFDNTSEGQGPALNKESNAADSSGGLSVRAAARRALGDSFRRGYGKWMLGGVERGSAYSLQTLLQDANFQQLVRDLQKILGQNFAASMQELIDQARFAEHRLLLAAVAAQAGDPQLLDFFSKCLERPDGGGMDRISSWGLARIGSEASLTVLERHIRARDQEGKPSEIEEYSLSMGGQRGLQLALKLTEEQTASGRIDFGQLPERNRLIQFCTREDLARDLAGIAASHPSAIVRVLALQPLCAEGREEDLSFVVRRLDSEPDEHARTAILEMLGRHAVAGNLAAMPGDLKVRLAEQLQALPEPIPGIRTLMLYRLDPDSFGSVAGELLLGHTNPELDKVRQGLAGYMARQGGAEDMATIEKYSLESDLRRPGGALRALSVLRRWSEPRLVQKLLDLVEAEEVDWVHRGDAVIALAKGPEEIRQQVFGRIIRAYSQSCIPEAREAILHSLPLFGDRGSAMLVAEAQQPHHPVSSLAAWHAVTSLPDFTPDSGLSQDAKSYLRGFPRLDSAAPLPGWHDRIARQYLQLFQSAYLRTGGPMDLEYLDRLARFPEFPIRLNPEEDRDNSSSFGYVAGLCAETIRMRYGK